MKAKRVKNVVPQSSSTSLQSCSTAGLVSYPAPKQTTTVTPVKMIVEGNRGIRAELLWAISCVHSKHSSRGASSGGLFAAMFRNSDIAAKFKMQKHRFIYLINCAIAPYIHNQLVCLINKSTYLSISFDESLNDSTANAEGSCHPLLG